MRCGCVYVEALLKGEGRQRKVKSRVWMVVVIVIVHVQGRKGVNQNRMCSEYLLSYTTVVQSVVVVAMLGGMVRQCMHLPR